MKIKINGESIKSLVDCDKVVAMGESNGDLLRKYVIINSAGEVVSKRLSSIYNVIGNYALADYRFMDENGGFKVNRGLVDINGNFVFKIIKPQF